MARSQWSKELSVFSSEFDAEHRELLRAADDLRHAMAAGTDPALAVEKARALIAEIEDHFASEERQMKAAHYSGGSWHKRQHETIRKRVALLEENAAKGNRKAVVSFVTFLKEWLVGHVAVADRMLAAHLRNHQRSQSQAS